MSTPENPEHSRPQVGPGGTPPSAVPPLPPRNQVTLPAPLASLPGTAWRWMGGAAGAFVVLTGLLGITLLLTLVVSGSGDLEDLDPTEAGGLIRGLAALAAFGWTGHVGVSYDDGDVTGGAGVTAPLTLHTVLALVALAATARWLTRTWRPTSRSTMWLQVGLVLAASLVVLLVVGLIGRVSEDDVTVSALGFGAIVRFLLVLAAALVGGIALAVPRGRRVEALFGRQAAAGYRWVATSLDALAVHVLAWLAVGLVGGLLVALTQDLPFVLGLAFLPTFGPATAAIGHLGGVTLAGSGDQDAIDFLPSGGDLDDLTFGLFAESAPWYLWVLPLLALAIVILVAVRLTLLRAPGSSIDVRQLGLTVGAFLVGWFVVVRVLGRLGASGGAESGEDSISGALSIGPPWWAFLLLALCGLAIELVHGFVGARLALALPRGLVQRLVPHPHPAWGPYLGVALPGATSTAPQAPPAPQAAPGPQAYSAPPVPTTPPVAAEDESTLVRPASGKERPAEDQPTSVNPALAAGFAEATTRAGAPAAAQPPFAQSQPAADWGRPEALSRRAKIVLGGCAGALVLAAFGWFLLGQISQRYFGPDGAALDYASAIVEGRGDDAIELGRVNVSHDHRALLGDDVYGQAAGRPSAAEVVEVEESEDGESATVVVEFEQEGERFTQSLTAERTGRTMVFFPTWQLQEVPVGRTSVTLHSTALEVNGQRIDLSAIASDGDGSETGVSAITEGEDATPVGYRLNLPAFPGSYNFAIPATTWTQAQSVERTVRPGGDGSATDPVELSTSPSQKFVDEVTAGVKAKIDDCSTDYRGNSPCPFTAPDLLGENESIGDVEIVVNDYPEVESERLEPPAEGREMDLPLGGSPSITEKGTYTEDTFIHDEGDSSESDRTIKTYGWSVTVKGDDLTVSWEDSY